MMPTNEGWSFDPVGRHQYRYWGGTSWSDVVVDDGVQAHSPPPTGLVPLVTWDSTPDEAPTRIKVAVRLTLRVLSICDEAAMCAVPPGSVAPRLFPSGWYRRWYFRRATATILDRGNTVVLSDDSIAGGGSGGRRNELVLRSRFRDVKIADEFRRYGFTVENEGGQ